MIDAYLYLKIVEFIMGSVEIQPQVNVLEYLLCNPIQFGDNDS